jgi:serine/threonine-protein kinase RsbT
MAEEIVASATSCHIEIEADADLARAIYAAHSLARTIGFSRNQRFMIATAVSELVQNVVKYAAGSGRVDLRAVDREGKHGIEIVVEDRGPGIDDIEQACREGFSTSRGSLGLGLPGARRLMDEFMIDPERELGTKVVMRKWL